MNMRSLTTQTGGYENKTSTLQRVYISMLTHCKILKRTEASTAVLWEEPSLKPQVPCCVGAEIFVRLHFTSQQNVCLRKGLPQRINSKLPELKVVCPLFLKN